MKFASFCSMLWSLKWHQTKNRKKFLNGLKDPSVRIFYNYEIILHTLDSVENSCRLYGTRKSAFTSFIQTWKAMLLQNLNFFSETCQIFGGFLRRESCRVSLCLPLIAALRAKSVYSQCHLPKNNTGFLQKGHCCY